MSLSFFILFYSSLDGEKHENYCVYFNKTCVIGPHLDPDKVAKIPDKTASVKPPAAVKLALEKIVEVAIDSVDTMDVIQEGFGAKLFSKGKSKVLKKVRGLTCILIILCIDSI